MTDVPEPVQTRIEAVLAETELAVIEIQQSPEPWESDGDGGFRYLAPSHAEQILAAVIRALSKIVQAVLKQELPAHTRRTVVEDYRDMLSDRYAISLRRLIPALQQEAWWTDFQHDLQSAVPLVLHSAKAADSIGHQVRALMHEAHWSIADLAEATRGQPGKQEGLSEKTIKRCLGHKAVPRPDTVTILEAVFTKKLNRPIRLNTPIHPARHRVPKKSPKRP